MIIKFRCSSYSYSQIIILCFIGYSPADPGVPQSLTALQSQLDIMNRCIVTALWFGPKNANHAQVTGYKVFTNGNFVTNATVKLSTTNINETRILSTFYVPYCAAHMISVSAINRCGRENTTSFILDPDQRILLSDSVFICNGAMGNDRCK